MKYVVIFKSGKTAVFSVKQCAQLYAQIYDGVVISTFDCQVNIDRLTETV